MSGTAEVRLTLTEGPVCGLGDIGIEASHSLWDSIIATESFPPSAGATGANYVVKLKKTVSHANEVRPAENELTMALQMLAAAWPFSGGSYLLIETREVVYSSRCKSNASDVERDMLARNGLTTAALTTAVPLGWSATYTQPPLCLAVRIAQSMRSDPQMGRLLRYHQNAVIERGHPSTPESAAWFISLYKVRELLCKLHGGERATKAALNIQEGWSRFGRLLNNNDLRHADTSGDEPTIRPEDVNELYRLAYCWVAAYLRTKRLPAIG